MFYCGIASKSVLFVCALSIWGVPASADDLWRESVSLYGTPGLIEMPSAQSAPDGTITSSITGFGAQQRLNFTFQITPRFSGTFRYTRFEHSAGVLSTETWDRSFDLKYQLAQEGDYLPALAVGVQDLMGTGLLSAEYLVATKTLRDNLRLSLGLGWGRLGSYNGFSNPLGVIAPAMRTRPGLDFGVGGTPHFNNYFRGDAAVFGGLEWRFATHYTLRAEYSSDAYEREATYGTFEPQSPLNFGLTYHSNKGFEASLYSLYGTDIGASIAFQTDPKSRVAPSGLEPAPPPVFVRASDARAALSWDQVELPKAELAEQLSRALLSEGVLLEQVSVSDRSLRLRYTNTRYRAEAQAMGRIARILSQLAPDSVETFVLEPMQAGIPLSAVMLRRSDIEDLENMPNSSSESFARASISDVSDSSDLEDVAVEKSPFSWSVAPYVAVTLFDGDNPARADFGLEASATYEIRPNLVLSGSIRKRLVGNRDEIGSISPSTLPPVRRNAAYYVAEGDPGIERLQLAYYGRPGENLYSRVSLGYLEPMFGGVSAELLWKPVDSRLGLGVELNYVAQRDYNMLFGFQDYQVATGHISAYYDFGKDFHGSIDVGRYLAGDWGATFSLDREFGNGWKVGGYFTLTDVPFSDFGEGSFDKGIRITIPMDATTGQPSRRSATTNISSLSRDGGARLNVDGRLYEIVRGGHQEDLSDGWGRFWR